MFSHLLWPGTQACWRKAVCTVRVRLAPTALLLCKVYLGPMSSVKGPSLSWHHRICRAQERPAELAGSSWNRQRRGIKINSNFCFCKVCYHTEYRLEPKWSVPNDQITARPRELLWQVRLRLGTLEFSLKKIWAGSTWTVLERCSWFWRVLWWRLTLRYSALTVQYYAGMKTLFCVCQFYCFWQHLPSKYTFVQQTASDVSGKFRSRLQWMLKSVTLNSGAYSKKTWIQP